MQRPKENIRKLILETARKEFFKHGFKKASMRTIARKADIALGNIYNYFKSKDELFSVILCPLLERIDELNNEHNLPEMITLEVFQSESFLKERIAIHVNFIKQFHNELNLLLNNSHGSKLASFRDRITDKFTDSGVIYIQKMKQKYPKINGNISTFFIHNMTSWWINIISEIVNHDLSHEEIEVFIQEYTAFSTEGWKRLMGA